MSGPTPDAGGGPARGPKEADAARTASEWVIRRDRGLTEAETAAFSAWLAADPRHQEEFERLEAAWRGLDHLGEVSELEEQAEAVMRGAQARRRARRRRWNFAVSFAAAAALAVLLFPGSPSRRETVVSAVPASVRVIESTLVEQLLPDGTRVQRNGTSLIESTFTPAQRAVQLVSGEAHFIVAKEPGRPFVVSADFLTVRAVGTAFNVRVSAESVEVLVTEGVVALSRRESEASAGAAIAALELTAGQKVVIPRAAGLDQPEVAAVTGGDIDDYLAWQSTRLVFDDTPLSDVVAAFNRYNAQTLVLGDPRLANRRLTGVFRADNLEAFVRLLRASVDVRGERHGDHEVRLFPAQ